MRGWSFMLAGMAVLMTPGLWAGSSTPFRLGDQGGVIVPVTVNDAGPFMMLLDTGATHSAMTGDAAAAAGARAVANGVVTSALGDQMRAIVSIDKMVLGPIVTGQVLPSVVPRDAFGAGVHGLIGQDVLAWLRYTLDFRRREVEWHDAAPPRKGAQLSLVFESGRFLVTLPQRSTTLRLVPDSGAGALVLFDTRAIGSTIVETGQTVELRTALDGRRLPQVLVRELRVGDRRIRDVTAIAFERPDRRPAEGDGLLPLRFFDRVTFDGPARLLILG